ncbi:hypothetical protein [Leekyejoonella antrihumi]|uniref:Uncharacterized protein n=1 Tax=Leekyejoonella antrihumi TaxID=1660198 RepID=A0A563E0T8_9MICO|nr:hypothetical protein [Leekyejoonella antrihumi]TWP35843.1 hypothetical protein FGL98_12650 [Leekyejoonella antrihumi]
MASHADVGPASVTTEKGTIVQVNPMSAIPAAGLAAATLLPGFTPRRRILGGMIVAGTYAAQAVAEPEGFQPVTVTPTTGGKLTKEQSQMVSTAASSAVVGLLAIPLVGVARILPVRRVFMAAAMAGGYVALDAKLTELLKPAADRARAARDQAMQARRKADDAHAEADRAVAKSETAWHQAQEAESQADDAQQ